MKTKKGSGSSSSGGKNQHQNHFWSHLPGLNRVRMFQRPRQLKSTFRSRWGRWWFRHPKFRQSTVFASTLLVVIIGLIIGRLWFVAHRILIKDNTAAALSGEVDPSQLRKEGDGRINLLLAGVGGEGHTGGDLSDSIMVVSFDPVSKDLAMISLPRDLYLPIEGFGYDRINAAHALGEQYGYDGGGPKLLADTITKVFDIPIHYYLRLDFQGFQEALEVVGGVEVEVKQTINDYAFPGEGLNGYEPFYLEQGYRHLDSQTALKYVRSRYGSSDFDRADRQQQVLLALKDKAFSLGTVLDPVKLNRLLSVASGNIKTNLSIDDGLKFAELVKQTQGHQIKRANLDSSEGELLVNSVVNGAWVLTPAAEDYTDIRIYLRSLMPDGYILRESAKVKIINAAGIEGLAGRTAEIMRSFGYQVTEVATADSLSDYTQVINYAGDRQPYTLNYLQNRFQTTASSQSRPPGQIEDITVVLGADYEITY